MAPHSKTKPKKSSRKYGEVKFDEDSRRSYVSISSRQKAKNERKSKAKIIASRKLREEVLAERKQHRDELKAQVEHIEHQHNTQDDAGTSDVESSDDRSHSVSLTPRTAPKVNILSLPSISDALNFSTPEAEEEDPSSP
ncbi:hypothetical protein GEMRC1_003930 [Eukaryota sp. GEM-RC1]